MANESSERPKQAGMFNLIFREPKEVPVNSREDQSPRFLVPETGTKKRYVARINA